MHITQEQFEKTEDFSGYKSISIYIEKLSKEIIEKLSTLKKSKQFIEVRLLYNLENIELFETNLPKLNIHRVVFVMQEKKDLTKLFVQCMINRIYPLTQGLAFCQTQIEHSEDLYKNNIVQELNPFCKECSMQHFCTNQNNALEKNLFEHPNIKDILKLKNENSTTRL